MFKWHFVVSLSGSSSRLESCQAPPGVQLSFLAQSLYGPPRHQSWAALKWEFQLSQMKWWSEMGLTFFGKFLKDHGLEKRDSCELKGEVYFSITFFKKRQVARTLTVWYWAHQRHLHLRQGASGWVPRVHHTVDFTAAVHVPCPPTQILGTNAIRLFSLTVNNNDRSWAEKKAHEYSQ